MNINWKLIYKEYVIYSSLEFYYIYDYKVDKNEVQDGWQLKF